MINEKMFELGNQGSKIREIFEYGKKRKAEIGNQNVFDFSIGNPSVACPETVTRSLIELISQTDPIALHGYSSSAGMDSTRRAIAEYTNKTFGANEDYRYIYLTPGAAAALTISLCALVNEGDEVIVFAPYFPEYKVYVQTAGGKLVVVQSDKKTLLPDMDKLAAAITPKTKVVIVNSPNNPTGVVYGEQVIKGISRVLGQKQDEYGTDIYLLSDEPYRELIYNDVKYPFVTNYYDNALVTYSFSKSLSLPGERVGYIIVGHGCALKDKVFKAVCGAGRALGYVCESTLFQHLIPRCQGQTADLNVYRQNRDLLYNGLKAMGYEMAYPDGAFYLFLKALEDDDERFARVAMQYELLLVPSKSFGLSGYVRVSYCVPEDQIINSLKAFEKLKKHYDGNN